MDKLRRKAVGLAALVVVGLVVAGTVSAARPDDGTHWGAPALGHHDGIIWE